MPLLAVTLLTALACTWAYMTAWFVLALSLRRNDMADIAWGPGVALAAYVGYRANDAPSLTATLLLCAVCVWAFRLAARIGTRAIHSHTEDPRYAAWRRTWRHFALRSYLQVFLLQGTLMVVVAYPLIHLATYDVPIFSPLTVLGLLVWLAGFSFEAIADLELDRFLRTRTPGSLLDTGLWRYSRHPNYFGEVLQWWGVWLAVLPAPLGALTAVSPLLMTALILWVSGIPLLEKRFAGNPAFEAYKRRTSPFIPLPPRA